ncbi:MAG: hypothetical protein HPY64_12155 [Anaerolineae bacterium]|nr:hypothetical protein [Anaerolineae bacterium]
MSNDRDAPTTLLGDFRLLLYLFIGLRLLLLIVYQPLVVGGVERGVTAGGDMLYYYSLAQLSDEGLYPYRDYWSEFPPLWPWLYVSLYRLLATGEPSYTAFASVLGLILLVFDTGNLILLNRIGSHLYGRNTGLALAWIYAALLAPAVFIWWNFEAIVAFALLLGLWWLLIGSDDRSSLAVAAGGLVKFVPLILLPVVWRIRPWRQALRYTLLSLGVFALVYAGLIAATGEMGALSLVVQFNKASYGTIWALLDGNYGTGVFGGPEIRTDPATALALRGYPPVVPPLLRLAVFGGLGLAGLLRTRRIDDWGVVALATFTLLIFFLWAQGWSAQWLVLLIPLVLLCFPTRLGVLLLLLLSFIVFTEYPLLFIRTDNPFGLITGALRPPFIALVIGRTIILVGLAAFLYTQLRLASDKGVTGED